MMKRYFHTLPGRAFQRIESCMHVHRLLYTPFYHDHHHITWTRKRKLWKVHACPSFLLFFLHPPGNHICPGWSWSVQQCFLLCTRFLSSLPNKWFPSYCVFTPWTDFFLFVSFFLLFFWFYDNLLPYTYSQVSQVVLYFVNLFYCTGGGESQTQWRRETFNKNCCFHDHCTS